jgi:hypothetical protein
LRCDGDYAGFAQLAQGVRDGLTVDAQVQGDLFVGQVFDAFRLGTLEKQGGDAGQEAAEGRGFDIGEHAHEALADEIEQTPGDDYGWRPAGAGFGASAAV